MVTAPKCKVCGSAHFGATHVWGDGIVARSMKPPLSPPVIRPDDRDAIIVRLRARIAELEAGKPKPKTADRAAYMREYRARKR